MRGLSFERQVPVVPSAPNRMDVACFVGLIARRDGELPSEIRAWLDQQGWLKGPSARTTAETLLDVPTPIGSWAAFDQLFAWEDRSAGDPGATVATYLGAAVRSFFAQGGRKCYVVRVGDPLPFGTNRDERLPYLKLLVSGYPDGFTAAPGDRDSWHGIGHLFGLPDVCFLAMPDLADLVAADDAGPPVEVPELPAPREQFVECSEPQAPPAADSLASRLAAPRCDELGYQQWASALRLTARLLARHQHQREVQCVAALPIPQRGSDAETDMLGLLSQQCGLAETLDDTPNGLASAFVQLTYPWLRTPGSLDLPERIESPEGVLIGLLARNALGRGTFRSAANLDLGDVSGISPALRRDQMTRPRLQAPTSPPQPPTSPPQSATAAFEGPGLIDRVSLFGARPAGLRLLSDVTTSIDERYRQAHVNRLVSAILRAARRIGEDSVFEPSGERLWVRLRNRMVDLLDEFYGVGALQGATPAAAFDVRCDRTTMSQADIDNGRAIAVIRFEAAAAISSITVVFTAEEGGKVQVAPSEQRKAA